MDLELTRRLLTNGYHRTDEPRAPGAPIVVHAVAGAGKTTFLRSLLTFRDVEVFTAGTHDPPSLTGKHIRCARAPLPGAFNILDEYPLEDLQHRALAGPVRRQPATLAAVASRTLYLRPHLPIWRGYRRCAPTTWVLYPNAARRSRLRWALLGQHL
jgi:hypothetical protein